MFNELSSQVEALFVKVRESVNSKMSIEKVQRGDNMEVRIFEEKGDYTVLVKAMSSAVIAQKQRETIIHQEKVRDPRVAVMLGDKVSAYLHYEKGNPCPVDLEYLSDEAKKVFGIKK